jgi:hypothetical protein
MKKPKNETKECHAGDVYSGQHGVAPRNAFLKQPVAAASISRDPLPRYVQMNGAKSDRLLVLWFFSFRSLPGPNPANSYGLPSPGAIWHNISPLEPLT